MNFGFTHPANELHLVSSKAEYVRKVKIMFDTEGLLNKVVLSSTQEAKEDIFSD